MSVSIFTPKAFSMRSRRRDRQTGRNDDLRPDEISGMGRVFHSHSIFSFFLVVVFQIHITDFVLCGVDAKCQTPVPCDAKAPGSSAVAGQRVRLPRRKCVQFVRIFHIVEECQHLP